MFTTRFIALSMWFIWRMCVYVLNHCDDTHHTHTTQYLTHYLIFILASHLIVVCDIVKKSILTFCMGILHSFTPTYRTISPSDPTLILAHLHSKTLLRLTGQCTRKNFKSTCWLPCICRCFSCLTSNRRPMLSLSTWHPSSHSFHSPVTQPTPQPKVKSQT